MRLELKNTTKMDYFGAARFDGRDANGRITYLADDLHSYSSGNETVVVVPELFDGHPCILTPLLSDS
jgi:hypothetical protein